MVLFSPLPINKETVDIMNDINYTLHKPQHPLLENQTDKQPTWYRETNGHTGGKGTKWSPWICTSSDERNCLYCPNLINLSKLSASCASGHALEYGKNSTILKNLLHSFLCKNNILLIIKNYLNCFFIFLLLNS